MALCNPYVSTLLAVPAIMEVYSSVTTTTTYAPIMERTRIQAPRSCRNTTRYEACCSLVVRAEGIGCRGYYPFTYELS